MSVLNIEAERASATRSLAWLRLLNWAGDLPAMVRWQPRRRWAWLRDVLAVML